MNLPLLQLGSNGILVKELQTTLQSRGYTTGEYGVFDIDTYRAVISFQASHGLVDDGIVGIGTWQALGVKLSKLESLLEFPPLQIGSRGKVVEKLQSLLKAEGYSIDVDGIFGFETLSAVLKLQAAEKIKADGIVGAKTWSRLRVPV